MISEVLAGWTNAVSLNSSGAVELIRGAIAGSLIASIAFLAGMMMFRRSVLTVCAFVGVFAAALLELTWLGFFSIATNGASLMLLGLFSAASVVFLSASIRIARESRAVSTVMYIFAALVVAMSVLSVIGRMNAGPALLMVVGVLSAGAVALSLIQAVRGDHGARVIVPGVLLVALAPLVGPLLGFGVEGFAIAPHAVFTLGVLAASFIVIVEGSLGVEGGAPQFSNNSITTNSTDFAHSHHHHHHHSKSEVRDVALLRVLDNAGVGFLDWGLHGGEQSHSLCEILGADCDAPFTPDALVEFIEEKDRVHFTNEVILGQDGEFDIFANLFDGRSMRFRGARIAHSGNLERLVLFVEPAAATGPSSTSETQIRNLSSQGASAVTGAVVAAGAAAVAGVSAAASAKLEHALENGEISAAFQPIVSLSDRKTILGYEALARWRDDAGNDTDGPEVFVRTADAIGKGAQLTQMMLEQTAHYLKEQREKAGSKKPFVTLNVSWTQMRNPKLADAIKDVLARFSLPKNALVLELTEGEAVTDDDEAGRVFRALKQAGAALAFDDFGAGFSCLSNLRKFDFDYLKIDKSYAEDLGKNGDGSKIVAALAGLGKELGLQVIVEGIEDMKSASAAAGLGCSMGQGYALGKPVASTITSAQISGSDEAKADSDKDGKEKSKVKAEDHDTDQSLNSDDVSDDEKLTGKDPKDPATDSKASKSDDKRIGRIWRRGGLR